MAQTNGRTMDLTPKHPGDTDYGSLEGQTQRVGFGAGLKRFSNTPVRIEHADVPILLCCFVSGLIDSNVFSAYGTFVGMQTGNTIFLGLGASNQNSSMRYAWVQSITSIACFFIGCLFFAHVSRLLGPLRRGTLVFSFFTQSACILITAALIQGGAVTGSTKLDQPFEWNREVTIALLSFQSAGQIVGSRLLSLNEIPTVVVTSLLCDFASDPKLLSDVKGNVKRNRRIAAFILLLVGAIVGGVIAKATGGMQASLWLAGALKALIMFAWMFWPAKPDVQT